MNWIVPSLEEELGELERVAKSLDIQLSALISLFQTGTIEEMSDEIWSKLENTDSWGTTEFDQVFEAASHAEPPRDAQALLEAFRSGEPMQTPSVLFTGGQAYLISGNTRLMICRATGIRPKIFRLEHVGG